MIFSVFSNKLGFWVFYPTVVSVLLSASVERCFVSRMRDFFNQLYVLLQGSCSLCVSSRPFIPIYLFIPVDMNEMSAVVSVLILAHLLKVEWTPVCIISLLYL